MDLERAKPSRNSSKRTRIETKIKPFLDETIRLIFEKFIQENKD